jgi:(2R)-ethylmalonyl-CoA mutase
MPERVADKIYDKDGNPTREEPWIFRTYGGHSNARATNELYRTGLARGQTGLSIAFDLATQCGYDSDHPMARPEVGKVGVPINSLADFRILFDQIPIEKMNTSMTINGTAMWLLSLYIALAEERGVDPALLQGTTQNDIIKEYLARGTYIFPPESSIRLIVDMYEYCVRAIPKWNPSNICSYHLQEAGASPVQELSFALVTAIGILDAIKARNCFSEAEFEQAVGRISFFVNSGMRFIEEMCKMRAFGEMWDEITKERYGVKTEKFRRFRYGVQVNSLGLTEEQPENNAWRILIEALGVTLSQKARCRALQLPAWNEALSLPRPWDQQWSLRLQQILAYETDLLEYPDLFDGSPVIQSKVNSLIAEAKAEIDKVLAQGGAVEAIKSGYMKSQLVKSQAERMSRIMTGELKVVGRNIYADGLPSPLLGGADSGIFKVDHSAADETLENLKKVRETRNAAEAEAALKQLEEDARGNANLMPASIRCAKAMVTTGEWANTLRKVFGEYRPLTGVEGQKLSLSEDRVASVRKKIEVFKEKHGHRPRFVIGKPGLDGHSNGAEMVAVAARHVGFDVIYSGIRLTPEEIGRAAVEENADLVSMSILSGSHLELVEALMKTLKQHKADKEIPLVVGGIIPESDFARLKELGAQHIFTPKDYDLVAIMETNLEIAEKFA